MAKQGIVKATVMVIFFTTAANLFSYLFQLLMGRMLVPEDYGLLFSLLSLWNILALAASSFTLVVAKYSAAFIAKREEWRTGAMLKSGMEKSTLAGIAVFAALLLLSPFIGAFLHSTDPIYLPVLFLSAFTILLLPLFTGMLQGMERFFGYGVTVASGPFFRLAAAVLLVSAGFGILGGLLGTAISCFAGVALGFWFLKDVRREGEFRFSGFGSYSALVLFSTVLFSALCNIDVVLARHFLSAEQAGIYSMVAVLGRIIIYAPAGVVAVLFPLVASSHEKGEATGGKLAEALVAVAVISGAVTAVYFLFPVQIISLLFGSAYLPAAEYLAPYGAGMMFLSLIGVFYSYYLSKGSAGVAAALAFTTILQILLVVAFHDSAGEMVVVVLASNLAGLAVFGIVMAFPMAARRLRA